MAVPKTKNELRDRSATNFMLLTDLVASYSDKEKEANFPPGFLNRNIRDVLAHLHHWHKLFLGWYSIGLKGQKPDVPAKGYSWKDSRALNTEIQRKYTTVPLNDILSLLQDSHLQVHQTISKHSEKELFEKKRFNWTGSSNLATYLRGASSSHYDWALKLIKRAKKKIL